MHLHVRENRFGFLELSFDVLSVLNLPGSFDDNFFVQAESAFDDEDVIEFARYFDEALMGDTLCVNHVDVALVQDLERGSLGDDHRVFDETMHPQGSRLTVAQETLGVRKVCAKGNVPRLVVEVRLDGDGVTSGVFEKGPVRRVEVSDVRPEASRFGGVRDQLRAEVLENRDNQTRER